MKKLDKIPKRQIKGKEKKDTKKRIGNLLSSLMTIFAVNELNFCVRDGNRCILTAIVTNSIFENK